LWLGIAPVACRRDHHTPQRQPAQSNEAILGLWIDEGQDYTLEVEFYDDHAFYYAYSDPGEHREGLGKWQREDDRFRLDVDSGMTYLARVSFPQPGQMTVETESAGTWEFVRPDQR
jgi:hypothetical protein